MIDDLASEFMSIFFDIIDKNGGSIASNMVLKKQTLIFGIKSSLLHFKIENQLFFLFTEHAACNFLVSN